MYLKLSNGFTFPLGTVDIAINKDVVENEQNIPVAVKHRWSLMPMLIGASATAIDALMASLNTAFSSNGFDMVLTMPNGTTSSQHRLTNAGALGGVRVTKLPSPKTFTNAGGVTNLDLEITVEAEYPVSSAASLLRSFEETLSFEGGGPVEGYVKTLRGMAQKQTLMQNDTYRCIQAGSAIGYYDTPSAPQPIFQWAMLKAPKRSVKSPTAKSGFLTNQFVSWSYEFESTSPLNGNPTVWS